MRDLLSKVPFPEKALYQAEEAGMDASHHQKIMIVEDQDTHRAELDGQSLRRRRLDIPDTIDQCSLGHETAGMDTEDTEELGRSHRRGSHGSFIIPDIVLRGIL